MYAIELSVRVQRFLDKLDAAIKTRIEKRLERLKSEPIPSDAKRLGLQAGQNVFRYRIGRFRVLYTVNTPAKVVLIHKIGKRSTVYQD